MDEQLRTRQQEEERTEEERLQEARRNRGVVWGREGDDWTTAWRSQSQTATAAVHEMIGEEETGKVDELVKMGKWAEENDVPEGCPAVTFDLAWTFS